MRESSRLKRARLRDRRRGHEGEELPALIRPLTGFDLFMVNEYLGTMSRTILMVTDPVYRGEQLLASGRRVQALRQVMGRPYEPPKMARALMPRRHRAVIEGRRDPDGRMLFLLSDPDRPSKVYARLMAEQRREDAPSDWPEGASSGA